MKELLKTLYKYKIKVMWYFGLGYSEVNSFVNLVKDIAILLGFAVIVFKFKMSIPEMAVISFATFLCFTVIGIVLKKSGMSDYANKLGNSINPEIKMIPDLAKRLDNIERQLNELGKSARTGERMVGNLPKHIRRGDQAVRVRTIDGDFDIPISRQPVQFHSRGDKKGNIGHRRRSSLNVVKDS